MQLRKWSARIYVLLFILSSLLLPSWSLDTSSATAQAMPAPPPFSRHNVYAAQPPTIKTSWEVDVDFIGSQIQAKWILRATDGDPYNPTVIEEYVYDLQCTIHGSVQINGRKAHFDPATQDHITCQLPSYGDLAQEFFGVQLKPVCDCFEPWVAAKVRVNPTGQNAYPVLFLEEMRGDYFEAQIEHKNRRRGAFKTFLSRWGRPQWSKNFRIGQSQILWSGENPMGFIDILAQRHARFSNDWINFWNSKNLTSLAGAQSLETYAATAPSSGRWHSWAKNVSGRSKKAQNTQMSTEPMLLYIGYNPTNGEYFSGTMWNAGIDPSCIGSGGNG